MAEKMTSNEALKLLKIAARRHELATIRQNDCYEDQRDAHEAAETSRKIWMEASDATNKAHKAMEDAEYVLKLAVLAEAK